MEKKTFSKGDVECIAWLLEELRSHFPDGVLTSRRGAYEKVRAEFLMRFTNKPGAVFHILKDFIEQYCTSTDKSFLLPTSEEMRLKFDLTERGLPGPLRLLMLLRSLRSLRPGGIVNKEDVRDARKSVLGLGGGDQIIDAFCTELVDLGLMLRGEKPHFWKLHPIEVVKRVLCI